MCGLPRTILQTRRELERRLQLLYLFGHLCSYVYSGSVSTKKLSRYKKVMSSYGLIENTLIILCSRRVSAFKIEDVWQESCKVRNRFVFKKLNFLGATSIIPDPNTTLTDFSVQLPATICEGNNFDTAMKNNQAMVGTCNIRTKCEQKYDEVKFIGTDQNGLSVVFDTLMLPSGCVSNFSF